MNRRSTPNAYASGVGLNPIQAAGVSRKGFQRTMSIINKRLRSHQRSLRASEDLPDIVHGPEVTIGGKQCLRQEVERDLVIEGKIVGTATYKVGEVKFPAVYWHDACEYAGNTVDARRSGDGKEWLILLHGVVTNKDGVPVVDKNGQDIEVGGWIRESALTPMDETEGMTQFIPGHSESVSARLMAPHTRKLVGFRAFHRTEDSSTFGPRRARIESIRAPKVVNPEAHNWVEAERPAPVDEVDDCLLSERREADEDSTPETREEDWRFMNEYIDRPQELDALLEGRDFVVEGVGPESPYRSPERVLRSMQPKRVRVKKS